jgi:hypothetical protein
MFCFSNITNPFLSLEPSRRNDMVSLGYTMIYFLRGLPWQGLEGEDSQDYDKIKGRMMATSTEDLCRDIPNEFAIYMENNLSLGYDGKPQYENLRKLFRDLKSKEDHKSKEGSEKGNFDWYTKRGRTTGYPKWFTCPFFFTLDL